MNNENRVYFERLFPLDEISNDIREHYPLLLNRLSVDEVNALEKNDMNMIEEIIFESQILNRLVTSYTDEIEEKGYSVYDTEIKRRDEELFIRCYAIAPEKPEIPMTVNLFSKN